MEIKVFIPVNQIFNELLLKLQYVIPVNQICNALALNL